MPTFAAMSRQALLVLSCCSKVGGWTGHHPQLPDRDHGRRAPKIPFSHYQSSLLDSYKFSSEIVPFLSNLAQHSSRTALPLIPTKEGAAASNEMWRWSLLLALLAAAAVAVVVAEPASTLDGPSRPVTVPLRKDRGHAVDLPDTDPRVQRRVTGWAPEQITVALSAAPTSAWVSWITGEFQMGGAVKPLDPGTVGSVVRYGLAADSLVRVATGDALVYSQLYPFEGLQNYTSGIIHHVRLQGLEPATKYYYQCGDPSIPGAVSVVHAFRTMPAVGPRSYPGRIAVVGDLGLTYNTTSTVEHMASNNPDLVLLVGDVSYANLYLTNGTGADCYSCSFAKSTPIHETYQPRWDYWGRYMEPVTSSTPMMVVEGNHEIEQQIGNRTFAAYSARFAFPSTESGSFSPFYYSFDVGGIHFIMLAAYADYRKSGEQYRWLEKDLAKVDRAVTPWLVAGWHAPWYSTYKSHYREAECMRVAMEELLYSHGLDVVFTGHVHAYERSNRVFNYTLDPCGPVHISVGDGGNREKMATTHADEPGLCPRPLSTPDPFMGGFCAFNFTSGPAAGRFCWDRQPDYSAYRESSFGHGILEVKNETHALWTWHRNQDLYHGVGDEIYIVREPERCLLNSSRAAYAIRGERRQEYKTLAYTSTNIFNITDGTLNKSY